MPKPLLPDGLSRKMRAGRAASEVLRAKIKETRKSVAPAMSSDVDGIHDMRVAVKRLREAVRLFRPLMPKKRRRVALALVDELNDALGRVRDPDVLMENAAWVAENAPDVDGFIAGLTAHLSASRREAYEQLLVVWERLSRQERIFRRLRRLARGTRKRRRPLNDEPFGAFAYETIADCADRVRERLATAKERDDPVALHRLRIAVKRLKYAIEPFLSIFPAAKSSYTAVADVQEALGLIHDFDVLEGMCQAHLQQNGTPHTAEAERALQVIRDRRAELHAEAWEQIGRIDADGWRTGLLECVR